MDMFVGAIQALVSIILWLALIFAAAGAIFVATVTCFVIDRVWHHFHPRKGHA